MSRGLRMLFLVHMAVALVFGVPLLLIPGRMLQWLNWAPIDPVVSRVLGAALLALGWSSFRGWQLMGKRDVRLLVEMEAAFTGLACVGMGRHLFFASYPLFPWLVFALFLLFFLAWTFFLVRRE
jgi:hypothetical protein